MAKRRSLQDDTVALKTKVKESSAKSENPEGNPTIRSLRKRLKRTQRKIRIGKNGKSHGQLKKLMPRNKTEEP